MALVQPANKALWLALRQLRAKQYDLAKKSIENALLLLAMSPNVLDPEFKPK